MCIICNPALAGAFRALSYRSRRQFLEAMPGVAKLYDAAIARGEGGRDHTAAFRYPAEG